MRVVLSGITASGRRRTGRGRCLDKIAKLSAAFLSGTAGLSVLSWTSSKPDAHKLAVQEIHLVFRQKIVSQNPSSLQAL